ncbi:transporter substrate-binding domain-containing protein [Legionella sp. W05-934-2]|uniref:transporter substrate-binding domain-containing protein n=1 Tax=Legionella sp. W05-934-2 TaxID=1198649 RepID=UPI003461BA7D
MRKFISFLLLGISLQLSAQQTLYIGTMAFNPPFSLRLDTEGHLYGFDISFMNEICKRIQANCVYKQMPFEDLFPALNNHTIDLAISGIIITPERQKDYLFSLPYFVSNGIFIVHTDEFKSIDNLRNKKIGVIKHSVYFYLAPKILGPDATIMPYTRPTDMLANLVSGNIQAIFTDEMPAKYWATKDDNIDVIGKPIPTGSGYGIMTNLNNDQLIHQINAAILDIEKDGTYLKLYNQFFNILIN